MTRDEIMLRVMHANPGELSRLSAFIGNGFKADAGSNAPASVPVVTAFITYQEAAAMIGCSTMTARRLRMEGEIEIAVVRGREKVVRASVTEYIERAKANNAPVTPRPVKTDKAA